MYLCSHIYCKNERNLYRDKVLPEDSAFCISCRCVNPLLSRPQGAPHCETYFSQMSSLLKPRPLLQVRGSSDYRRHLLRQPSPPGGSDRRTRCIRDRGKADPFDPDPKPSQPADQRILQTGGLGGTARNWQDGDAGAGGTAMAARG